MFDTMTFTKILGSFCGALLIYLMSKWAAETLYHVGGGHGDEHASAYIIETAEAEDDAPEEEVDFTALLASADVGKGERVFGKCRACHKLDEGANATGPYLYSIVDREIGSASGFSYSGALPEGAWDVDALNGFLEKPKAWAPGTTMAFNGLAKPEDRANLIAYLQTIGN